MTQDGRPSVLLVDDVTSFRETLCLELADRGYRVQEASNWTEAEAALAAAPVMFVVLDLRLVGEDGHVLIPKIKTLQPATRVVVLTGYGSVASAVQAMRLGASNYLTKPVGMDRLESAFWSDDVDPQEIAAPDHRESLARHEREYLEYVLRQCGGNITQAAEWLGIHRQSLQRKLRKFPPQK
jgi:two-component system response regulator RegA